MDQNQYTEMIRNLNEYESLGLLRNKTIFLFGHCEASLTVIDELLSRGYEVKGILDNSKEKWGLIYKDIPVVQPYAVMEPGVNKESTIVFLATRFYEQMNRQLRDLGFVGRIVKLVDYNTFSEYSLSSETIVRKFEREKQGEAIIENLKERFEGAFLVFCPFNALGDIYYCLSYLPLCLSKRAVERFALIVPSESCKDVARLFGTENIAVLEQKDLDSAIQAVLFSKDRNAFIVHQDRPYVVNLHKALGIKKISLEEIYKVGVFGLDADALPVLPNCLSEYGGNVDILYGRSAILSPYAKSVTALPKKLWNDIVENLRSEGYLIYTNVVGKEEPLAGTLPISYMV